LIVVFLFKRIDFNSKRLLYNVIKSLVNLNMNGCKTLLGGLFVAAGVGLIFSSKKNKKNSSRTIAVAQTEQQPEKSMPCDCTDQCENSMYNTKHFHICGTSRERFRAFCKKYGADSPEATTFLMKEDKLLEYEFVSICFYKSCNKMSPYASKYGMNMNTLDAELRAEFPDFDWEYHQMHIDTAQHGPNAKQKAPSLLMDPSSMGCPAGGMCERPVSVDTL
jgi:hypothetical protein